MTAVVEGLPISTYITGGLGELNPGVFIHGRPSSYLEHSLTFCSSPLSRSPNAKRFGELERAIPTVLQLPSQPEE